MIVDTLEIASGGEGLKALLVRAIGLDAHASARLRQYNDTAVEVFVTTPFETLASRRVAGTLSRDGAVVNAANLLAMLQDGGKELGPPRDAAWPGALPAKEGFELIDTIPVTVVRSLADEGQRLTREFSGPLGPPASLLNQTVVTVDNGDTSVEIPMRMIFTCTSLGLIPGFSAPIEIPRHLRVSSHGSWVRLDAPFGSVYKSMGLGGVFAL